MSAAPRPSVPTWSSAAVARALAAAVVVVDLVVFAVVGSALRQSWAHHRDRAVVATQNLSGALESQLETVIDKVDLSLLAVADEWQHERRTAGIDGPTLDAFIARQRQRVPELDAIRTFDAAGDLQHGDIPPGARVNIADRPYFAQVRADPGAGLVLSKPIVGRISGRPELILSRALRTDDGRFAGTVAGVIRIATLARSLEGYDVGPNGVIVLRDAELGLMVRRQSRGTPPALGDRTVSPELRALVDAQRTEATYAGVAVDGVERTFTFRRLRSHPLYVIVGLAFEDYLGPWRRETAVALSGAGAFALLGVLAAVFGWRSYRRREAAVVALAREETRFRLLAESVTDVIWMSDEQGALTYVSPAIERFTGYTPDEMKALPPERLYTKETCDRTAAALARIRAAAPHSQPFASEVLDQQLLRRDGTTVHGEVHFNVLWSEDGRPLGAIGVTRDVTERREMLARVQAAERLASLGTLAAGVAHEVNNPLTYVLSNVAFAEEQLRDAEAHPAAAAIARPLRDARQALGDAMSGAVRVRDIVRDLKTFSRPENDAPAAVDVNRVVEGCLKMTASVTARRARVVRRLGDVPAVRATEARLSQVVLNLVVNAAQAFPADGAAPGEIQVTTALAPDGRVELAVADTGPGIPAELLPRIFDPFFTTKPVGEGTGLGLSICHGIVKGLGGEIRIETAEGRGTRFSVLLPVQRDGAVANEAPPA